MVLLFSISPFHRLFCVNEHAALCITKYWIANIMMLYHRWIYSNVYLKTHVSISVIKLHFVYRSLSPSVSFPENTCESGLFHNQKNLDSKVLTIHNQKITFTWSTLHILYRWDIQSLNSSTDCEYRLSTEMVQGQKMNIHWKSVLFFNPHKSYYGLS